MTSIAALFFYLCMICIAFFGGYTMVTDPVNYTKDDLWFFLALCLLTLIAGMIVINDATSSQKESCDSQT